MNFPPSPSKILTVGLGGIAVSPERLRALRPDRVAEIAASMQESGLLQPIVLRTGKGMGYWLVAGRHRFEAAKLLKWDSIRACIHEDMEAVHAELAEIDENLIRADLSPAEHALHVHARKTLYEKLHPETKHGSAPGKAGGGKKAKDAKLASFVEDTAKKTNTPKRTIARDATRGKKVTVLADIVGTSLDKGDELDALAKLDDSEQQKLAVRAKAGEKVSAKTAEFAPPDTRPPLDQQRLIADHGSVAAAASATVRAKADRAAEKKPRKVPDPKPAADRAEARAGLDAARATYVATVEAANLSLQERRLELSKVTVALAGLQEAS
jgi:ParB/Sulfiredoxin domain